MVVRKQAARLCLAFRASEGTSSVSSRGGSLQVAGPLDVAIRAKEGLVNLRSGQLVE